MFQDLDLQTVLIYDIVAVGEWCSLRWIRILTQQQDEEFSADHDMQFVPAEDHDPLAPASPAPTLPIEDEEPPTMPASPASTMSIDDPTRPVSPASTLSIHDPESPVSTMSIHDPLTPGTTVSVYPDEAEEDDFEDFFPSSPVLSMIINNAREEEEDQSDHGMYSDSSLSRETSSTFPEVDLDDF